MILIGSIAINILSIIVIFGYVFEVKKLRISEEILVEKYNKLIDELEQIKRTKPQLYADGKPLTWLVHGVSRNKN